jgi:hypothetical protein
MSYKKVIELSPSYFKRLYGVSSDTFWKMVEVVRNAKQGSRGSHAKLSIPDQILLTLQYWREYRTYFHIAQDWGIHEATAYRTVKRIEDILSKADEFHLPGQRQLQQSETEIGVIVVDVAETEIERPKKNRNATIAGNRNAIQ